MTVATCVCCSMISETHTRYAVRWRCHGRSCRPWRACQPMSEEAKSRRPARDPAVTSLHLQPHVLELRAADLRMRELQCPLRMQRPQRALRQLERLLLLRRPCQIAAEVDLIRPQCERPCAHRRVRDPSGDRGGIQLRGEWPDMEGSFPIAPACRD